jgi:hypothetical protein
MYGCNPQQAAQIISRAISKGFDRMKLLINEATAEIKDFTNKIQNMPVDEFQQMINDPRLTLEQKALVIKIRNEAKAKEAKPIDERRT